MQDALQFQLKRLPVIIYCHKENTDKQLKRETKSFCKIKVNTFLTQTSFYLCVGISDNRKMFNLLGSLWII